MTTIIEAVYEGGLFRPVDKVELKEGTRVELRVPAATPPRSPKSVAEKLSDLAAKAPRTGVPDSTARNHDQVLYGGIKE